MTRRPAITLVTPTHDRPQAFALCEKYMARQTVKPDRWIVVDDGVEPARCTLGQERIRLLTIDTPRESFRKNWLTGLQMARGRILCIEDDDWYRADYIEQMAEMFDARPLIGEARARYFNVRHRMFLTHTNRFHASLCQTGIGSEEIRQAAVRVLETDKRPEMLDGSLWRRSGVSPELKLLRPSSTICVGIKAVPGRGGMGVGHSLAEMKAQPYQFDPSAEMLRRWIGEEDAVAYLPFYQPEQK